MARQNTLLHNSCNRFFFFDTDAPDSETQVSTLHRESLCNDQSNRCTAVSTQRLPVVPVDLHRILQTITGTYWNTPAFGRYSTPAIQAGMNRHRMSRFT